MHPFNFTLQHTWAGLVDSAQRVANSLNRLNSHLQPRQPSLISCEAPDQQLHQCFHNNGIVPSLSKFPAIPFAGGRICSNPGSKRNCQPDCPKCCLNPTDRRKASRDNEYLNVQCDCYRAQIPANICCQKQGTQKVKRNLRTACLLGRCQYPHCLGEHRTIPSAHTHSEGSCPCRLQ